MFVDYTEYTLLIVSIVGGGVGILIFLAACAIFIKLICDVRYNFEPEKTFKTSDKLTHFSVVNVSPKDKLGTKPCLHLLVLEISRGFSLLNEIGNNK